MRGIKTKIGINIVSLLLISAVITDVFVIIVVQNMMIRNEISRNRQYLENIGRVYFLSYRDSISDNPSGKASLTSLLLSHDGINTVYIMDVNKNTLYSHVNQKEPIVSVKGHITTALVNRSIVVAKSDATWALFGWYPRNVNIAIPIFLKKKMHGAIGAVIPLTPIYMTLRKYHKPIFFYILINTVVLTVVGLYRIFRLYFRPFDRIVLQADEFHENDDLFFAFRQEDNELNRLSSALNRMFSRISSDKKKLQATVASLEHANRELKNAQKEIIRAEKMASVGRLAAGIAHEIGNPIGIVLGYLDMLKRNNIDEGDMLDFLQRTENEVERINTIIRQLLDLARPKDTKNEGVNVSLVLEDIIGVMKLQPVMRDVQIELYLEALNNTIWCNADQLRQVFLNLLLNAADAIQCNTTVSKGNIQVRVSSLDDNEDSTGSLLQVMFKDNGGGIDPENLRDIFDPFFTTKEPGRGTGLGLAVSYMIIEGIGGTIRAESQIGQGATFSIELPLIETDKNP